LNWSDSVAPILDLQANAHRSSIQYQTKPHIQNYVSSLEILTK
jgi:hypothetical protein